MSIPTPAELDAIVAQRIEASVTAGEHRSGGGLAGMARLLGKWRQAHMDRAIFAQTGGVVMTGPFAGLQFVARSTEGCHAPKLIGCYESELHPIIETIAATPYQTVLNIGCAEGYYAVGLARRMPNTRAIARDTDERAQASVRAVAARNGVSDRVETGGLFTPADFAAHAGTRTLVVCDIEGAEEELLNIGAAPALAGFDMLVEAHDCFRPGVSDRLAARFAATHHIERIQPKPEARSLPPAFDGLGDLERLMLVWEWRTGPTPWLWMTARRD